MMKVLAERLDVSAKDGVVFVKVVGADTVVVLSTEGARNLVFDLEEAAGVAELENSEWKAEREEAGQSESLDQEKS